MEISDQTSYSYFQYFKGLGLPIYLRLNLAHFQSDVVELFKSMKFEEMSPKEVTEMEEGFSKEKFSRLLTIEEATPGVMRQIGSFSDSDRFGSESIQPKDGYQVYRYRGLAMMLYAHSFKEWQMGCSEDFGVEATNLASRVVINRFLSWSLAPLGIIGFWGVPVDEGMVVMKPSDSNGEVVFIDVFKRWSYTQDGNKRIKNSFKLLKLDSSLKERSITMSGERFLTFLTAHCTYFSYGGHSIPVRQMIQSLCRNYEGHVYPLESFQPRTDLNL
ncbi:hypothetical protein A9Q84_07265 [Halobacteriovorax marinus]|uniref:Uncharacterized protein n=1 Tax=Halobacteriovorax marinus TaxID=97084 RepID=A0A1Y5FBZ7_9BACT|nr:hypothetical protein A9Q84_07265 [Halobacteriovorax marinus]